jgi:DNA-3-methyladenine glycosylase II
MIQSEIFIEAATPYDFSQALGYLRRSPSAVLEEIGADWYRRTLTVGEQDLLVTVRSIGNLDWPKLSVEMEARELDERVVAEVTRQVTAAFSLDDDPSEFLLVAASDPVLARLVNRFPGVRPVLIPNAYEALIWAIIGQQINVSFARKLKTTLIELCGRSFQTYPVMPSPETVASLEPEQLRRHQFSRQKIAYILETSQAIAAGDLDLAGLASLSHDDALAVLTHYRGIGRWTAEYVLMRGLGARDSIPAADLGLRSVIGRAYGLGRHATESEVRSLSSAWQPYRGWASFYWWTGLQAGLTGTELAVGSA